MDSELTIDRSRLTIEDVQEYARRHGQRALNRLMTVLGHKRDNIEAIESAIGQKLLSGITDRLEEIRDNHLYKKYHPSLHSHIISDEQAEYRALSNIRSAWVKQVSEYERLERKLRGLT